MNINEYCLTLSPPGTSLSTLFPSCWTGTCNQKNVIYWFCYISPRAADWPSISLVCDFSQTVMKCNQFSQRLKNKQNINPKKMRCQKGSVWFCFSPVPLMKKTGDMEVLKQKCSVHLLTFIADMSYRSLRSNTPSLISTRVSTGFKLVLAGLLTLTYMLRHHHYFCCYHCTLITPPTLLQWWMLPKIMKLVEKCTITFHYDPTSSFRFMDDRDEWYFICSLYRTLQNCIVGEIQTLSKSRVTNIKLSNTLATTNITLFHCSEFCGAKQYPCLLLKTVKLSVIGISLRWLRA